MFILIIIGIILIYSATHLADNPAMQTLYKTQLIWTLVGVVCIYIVVLVPFRFIYDFTYVFYALSLCILVMVLITGSSAAGATRWFAIGPIKLQPSEFAKLAVILALARHLSSHPVSFQNISSFVVPLAILLFPMALIVKQPDLSTSLVFCAVFIPMIYWGGLSVLELFFFVSPVLSLVFAFNIYLWAGFFILLFFLLVKFSRNIIHISSILTINFLIGIVLPIVWNRLHDYQKSRIVSFIDPTNDPFGAGYQVIQSKVAIGSGKILGKGFLKATQTSLSFLPEQHTDFIFSVLGEQFGFLGTFFVLLLFSVLIARLFSLASENKNRFSNLVMVGISSQLAFHVLINISMTVGMMPVTGLPLPFLSYGGSSLISSMILIGLAASLRKKSEDY